MVGTVKIQVTIKRAVALKEVCVYVWEGRDGDEGRGYEHLYFVCMRYVPKNSLLYSFCPILMFSMFKVSYIVLLNCYLYSKKEKNSNCFSTY